MISQREFIYQYNKKYREPFNKNLFFRNDEDIINAIKAIVYSCERNSNFVIKITNFEVIDDYDDINHILWEYEDSIINKGKKSTDNKKTSNNKKKKLNVYEYINLNDSDLKLIKVTYYIKIEEKKRGWVDAIVPVYIAVPRIVDDFYFRLNGNTYSAMYQIVDASTYNNSASKNAKKQSITFKTVFTPIRVYRYNNTLHNIDGEPIVCNYFVINIFKKSILLMKYLLAKFGFWNCIRFLQIDGIDIVDNPDIVDLEINYVFNIRDNLYITVNKHIFNSIQICQSFVYTIIYIIGYMKEVETVKQVLDRETYIKSLGGDFTNKNIDTVYDKGLSLLESLEFNYDELSKKDLKLDYEDKADIYRVLRWMMYEFNSLRQKDNLNISTKKVRYAEYIASLYATKLATGIYRISDKADKADLDTIRKAIQIPPMYLINAIIKCQLVNYKNCVNDLDSIIALKYTYKGVTGIGEKSNAVSDAYRSIHPSHLGRVDVDSSSNSDPGVSGTICPYAELHDGHFDEYKEPSTWREDILKIMDVYRATKSKVEMCRIINDHKLNTISNKIQQDCLEVAKSLINIPIQVIRSEEYIDGFDIFGDGLMFYTRE